MNISLFVAEHISGLVSHACFERVEARALLFLNILIDVHGEAISSLRLRKEI